MTRAQQEADGRLPKRICVINKAWLPTDPGIVDAELMIETEIGTPPSLLFITPSKSIKGLEYRQHFTRII